MRPTGEHESAFAGATETEATLGGALAWAAGLLASQGCEMASLDAQLLLGGLLGLSRAALLAWPERALTPARAAEYSGLVRRRAAGEPLAYITGRRDWLDMTLLVDSRVLIPRPETETLAEAAIAWASGHGARLAVDVGTGSGALALALARHVATLRCVVATDLSAAALEVAYANRSAQGVVERVDLRQGYLLDPLRPDEAPDLLVANLPYVPAGEMPGLQREVRDHEPRLALVGGVGGHELIVELLEQAQARLAGGAALYLEMHHDQGPVLLAVARRLWPGAAARVLPDDAGRQRILEVLLPA